MSADDNILKSFLYQIGAKIDEPSVNRAQAQLGKLEKGVLGLGAIIEGLALTLAAVTIKMADGFEKMYWSSQRTGSSVRNMKAFEYGVSQLGGTVEGAHGALESFAAFMRRTPAASTFIKTNFGVSDHDAQGNLKDQALYLQQILEVTGRMYQTGGAQRAKGLGLAAAIGVTDEDTLRAVINPDFIGMLVKYNDEVTKAGVNLDQTAKDSKAFMQQTRDLGAQLDLLKDKVFASLEGKLGDKLVQVTDYLKDHLPEISTDITNVAGAINNIADAITSVVAVVTHLATALDHLVPDWLKNLLSRIGPAGTIQDLLAGKYNNLLAKLPGAVDAGAAQAQRAATVSPGFQHQAAKLFNAWAPRGLRNNNPGNIRYGKFAQSQGASGQDADGFAVFPTLGAGVAASSALLSKYLAGGINTVSRVIARWAPPSENNTKAYTNYVSKRLGVGADQPLTAAQVQGIQSSIYAMEVGSDNWHRASQGLSGAPITIHNDTDIHVNGADDPHATAAAVASQQGRAYADQLRNTKGALQ